MSNLGEKSALRRSSNNFDLTDQQWVLSVIEILAGLWGHLRRRQEKYEKRLPLDGLILTILSKIQTAKIEIKLTSF